MPDFIAINEIQDTINTSVGNSSDASTAKTVMGKLNKLNSVCTPERAAIVENTSLQVAINNIEDKNGTLSQKASYLINQRQASLTGGGIQAFYYANMQINSSNDYRYMCIAKFIAPIDGIYAMGVYLPIVYYTSIYSFYRVVDGAIDDGSFSQDLSYDCSTIGGLSNIDNSGAIWWSGREGISKFLPLLRPMGTYTVQSNADVVPVISFSARAGEKVQIIVSMPRLGISETYNFRHINIEYQGR